MAAAETQGLREILGLHQQRFLKLLPQVTEAQVVTEAQPVLEMPEVQAELEETREPQN